MRVIGLSGPAGSGKDLVADWFVDYKGFAKIGFADPLKAFCKNVFGYSDQQLWGPSYIRNERPTGLSSIFWEEAEYAFEFYAPEFIREVIQKDKQRVAYIELRRWIRDLFKMTKASPPSPRESLQTLGTEWGRAIDPLLWVNYTYSHLPAHVKGVVIPDHRFHNEIEETRKRGGDVIRLRRISLEGKKVGEVGVQGHISETEQQGIPDYIFSHVLELPEGIEAVHNELRKVFASV